MIETLLISLILKFKNIIIFIIIFYCSYNILLTHIDGTRVRLMLGRAVG